jgi:hypothetical protein
MGWLMKPIVPGCLALYHAGPSAAIRYYPPRVVTVISGPADMGVGVCLNCHKSDGDCIVDGLPNGYNSVCSCVLTRIDGGDPDAITETEKELEHANHD